MKQSNSSFPIPPGIIRPVAIGLMVLGAAGFLIATVQYGEMVLCQLGATLVVFAGLGMVIFARRQADGQEEPPARSAARRAAPQPARVRAVPEPRRQAAQTGAMPPVTAVQRSQPDADDLLPEGDRNSLGGLAGEVLAVYERKGAYVRVEASRPGRSIVRATLPDGMRVTVLVLEGQEDVDVSDVRALFALVNEHSSARGFLAARGAFSERARAWADSRGLRLLNQGELWKLGIG